MIKHFKLNEKGRDFVVGDIHGCFDKLTDKLREINFDTLKDRLFSVGDMVDRGDKSEECLTWINKSWFHPVRGNHEQMAIDYVNGEYDRYGYMQNGGAWFIALPEIEQKCFAVMFDDLPAAIDVMTKNGLVGIVHADCPLDDWSKLERGLLGERAEELENSCLWDRTRFEFNETSKIKGVHEVIVGHTPTNEPTYRGNVRYIDTGAVFGRELTVVEI
ncbi:MAG: metallophosphoesterase [Methylobacter sp.]